MKIKGITFQTSGVKVIKKVITLCVLIPSISLASENLETNIRKAMASAECLAYLTIVYENTQKAENSLVKSHAEHYVSAMKKVLADPKGKEHLKDGLYSRSGVNFDDSFYAGVIFSGTVSERRQSIKDSIPLNESASMPFSELKIRISDEAEQRYNTSNCDLLI